VSPDWGTPSYRHLLNAVIHRVAVTQMRLEPRAREIYDNARPSGHTRREAMRLLKRNLSNAIYRTMARDARQPSLFDMRASSAFHDDIYPAIDIRKD
jgi:hypothetical protein